MELRFDGNVAVVTGGATGIGAATVRLLAELGARVAILDKNVVEGAALAASIASQGMDASFWECDVSSRINVERTFDAVESKYGSLHLLVGSAGIQRYGDIVNTTLQDWDDIFSVHVDGCFHVARRGVQAMVRSGGGSFVAVGSVQALTAVANSVAYVAAKHALVGIVRSVALDFAARNVRANCVLPGTIDTPMLHWAANLSPDPQAVLNTCAAMHAMRRLGKPEEVARAIAFLLSDWASFITGATLLVDGGMLIPTGGMGFADAGIGLGAI